MEIVPLLTTSQLLLFTNTTHSTVLQHNTFKDYLDPHSPLQWVQKHVQQHVKHVKPFSLLPLSLKRCGQQSHSQ